VAKLTAAVATNSLMIKRLVNAADSSIIFLMPIINPVVLLSTFYAFGGSVPLMLARMGFGIVCSVLIGLLFTRERKSVFKANGTVACACGHAHEAQETAADHLHSYAHEHAHRHDHVYACEHEYNHAQTHTCEHEHVHDRAHGYACTCGHDHAHAHTHGTLSVPEAANGCAAPVACCTHTHATDTRPQAKQRVHGVFRARVSSLVTHFRAEFFEVARYLLIGIGVSTVLQMVLGKRLQAMQFDSMVIGMLVMMLLAFLLSLCSSSDAVVAKNMGAALPMGAEIMNVTAAGSGTPLRTRLRNTGIEAQSQMGRINPPKTPNSMPPSRFLGKIR